MRSGYHHIRGGDCSKFQHSSYVGTLMSDIMSSHDIKGTPVSVVPPENGIKNNMVAILPGELRVAHGPAQLQQGYAHSKQHFKGLHCHPKSQSSILDCGFQPQNIAKSVYNTSHQQQVCSRSVRRDKVLPVGELEPPTDDEIRDYVAKRVRFYRNTAKHVPSKKLCNRDSPLQSDPISPKVDCFSHPPKTSAFDREDMGRQTLSNAVNEECTAAVGPALEEDSSKGSKAFAVLLPKSKGIDDCSASASEKHSKEHPRKRKKVPATCTREEDGRPEVAAAVPEMTCEEMTEKQSSLIFHGSPSEEQKSFSLNIKTYFGDKSQLPGVSRAPEHTMERETAKVDLKPVEAVGLDSLRDMNDVSGAPQIKLTSVLSENKTFGQASLIENQQCTTLYSAVDALKIHNVWSIPTNQSEGHSSQTSYEGPRKDAGSTCLQTDSSIAISENKVDYFPTASEDIMKDESHIDDMTAETSSTSPDPNDKQSSFENEGAGLKDEDVNEGDYEEEDDDEDDEDDDDMLFIPITISDVTFEDQVQESHEKDGLDGGETEDQERRCDPNPNHYTSPKPVLACSSTQMKEFDTIASFLKAVNSKKIQVKLVGTPELAIDSEGEGHTPHNRRQSSDSCETDDSCDYPFESDNKHLSLSRRLLGKKNISNNNDIIIIQSDSEDDVEQKKPKRKTLFTSSSGDSDSSTCSRPKTHSSETVGSRCETSEENSTKKPRISADSPTRQSKCHDAPFEEGMRNPTSDLLHSEEIIGQLGGSTESVIVIDSDTEDDDQNKEPSRNTFICSGSDDSDRRCVEQKRQSPLTVKSGNGSAKDILQEARPSSADLSQSLNQSMLHDAPQKTNGHDSNVIKKRHYHKRRVKSKRIVSSESEESDDETVDSLCGTANEKLKNNSLSSKDPKEEQPQSLNKKANSTSGSKSVIPRSVVENPNQHHKLFKQSNNDGQVKDFTPKSSTASSEKTDSVDKNTLDLPKPKRANDGPHTTKHNVQANVTKTTIFSRQHSLPGQKSPSTSVSEKHSKARRSSADSRDLSPSGETPASSNHPASKQSIYTPRHNLSTLELRCSVSARKRLTKEINLFIPIGNELNKKLKTKSTLGMEDDVTTGILPSQHNKAPIQRQNSKSATALMKRTKFDAVQLTKARIRDTPKEQGKYDCEGYKWSEKPKVTKPIQGLSRKRKMCRSHPRPR